MSEHYSSDSFSGRPPSGVVTFPVDCQEEEKVRKISVFSEFQRGWIKCTATAVADDADCISTALASRLMLPIELGTVPAYEEINGRTLEVLGKFDLTWVECESSGDGCSQCTTFRVVEDAPFEMNIGSQSLAPAISLASNPECSMLMFYNIFEDIDKDFSDRQCKMADDFFDSHSVTILERLKPLAWDDERSRLGSGGDTPTSPIKVAILDTGVDWKHPDILGYMYGPGHRIRERRGFVDTYDNNSDIFGHGTHITALVLKFAPNSQVYIAKIAENSSLPEDHNVAEAIEWAACDCNVDIIVMSFGLERQPRDSKVTKAIMKAAHRRVLMFAAASNDGGNRDVAYPASLDQVICINSTDGQGNHSLFNPTKRSGNYNFATLGEAVNSAWPLPLIPEMNKGETEMRKSGSSVSTPIAAALAACILEFAIRNRMPLNLYEYLHSRQGMQAIFLQMSNERMGFNYIHPLKLFDQRDNGFVLKIICDCLCKEFKLMV